MATKDKQRLKQRDLFDRIQLRPQWETLPAPIRKELIPLLREMLFSPAAQEMLEQMRNGGGHE